METILNQLFDFQKYEGNTELQQIISSVHGRYARQRLDLDEVEYVTAAGTPYLPDEQKNMK